jgi:hypothetical protein
VVVVTVVLVLVLVLLVNWTMSFALRHLHFPARLFSVFVASMLLLLMVAEMGIVIMWYVCRRMVTVTDG